MREEEIVYTEGKDYFDALFNAMAKAKEEIILETYIYREGQLTQRLYEAFKSARDRGVRVRITVDGAGAYGATEKLLEFCALNDVQLKIFNPITWKNFVKAFALMNKRNHRKLAVIDSTLAFVSSLNITDAHFGEDGKRPWKDYGLSFRGNGVAEIIEAFNKAFERDSLGNFPRRLSRFLRERFISRESQQDIKEDGVILNYSFFRHRESYKNVTSRIRDAKNRIWIGNAYILPELKLHRHLKSAAKRGVDVRLLTSGESSDVFFMPWLSRLYYKKNIRAGIHQYEYQPSFFHGKVFLADDYVTIGSSNLNHRSIFHDLEVDVVLQDKKNVKLVEEDLEKAFSESKLIRKEDLKKISVIETCLAYFFSLFKYWF